MSVSVAGVAQVPNGDHVELGTKELFGWAVAELASDMGARWDPSRIDAAFIGSLSCGQGMQLGNFAPALLDHAGLSHVPGLHVESACASGGFAVHEAIRAVASGQYRCVLAAGVEKMRDVSGEMGRYWLGISGDTEYERLSGMTFAGMFALVGSRLIHEGVCTREDFGRVAVKNHRAAVRNPKAHLRREVSLDQVLAAPEVAAPLGVLDCCPTSDGAAVVLVADHATARELSDQPVDVLGWASAGDTLAVHSRPDITRFAATERAAAHALRAAGLAPADIDVAELHDCFTVSEVVNLIELGFTSRDRVAHDLRDGRFELGGALPVNVSGGLKAKGHPIAATGVGQVVELANQLRGALDAAERQVPGARTALAHNMGGSGASVVVTILGVRA